MLSDFLLFFLFASMRSSLLEYQLACQKALKTVNPGQNLIY